MEVAAENVARRCLIASFYLKYDVLKRILWKKNPYGRGSPSWSSPVVVKQNPLVEYILLTIGIE